MPFRGSEGMSAFRYSKSVLFQALFLNLTYLYNVYIELYKPLFYIYFSE